MKNYTISTAYVLYTTDYEGRPLSPKGYYSQSPVAGVLEYVKEVNVLVVEGETYLLERPEPVDIDGNKAQREARLREEALSKLSDAEKKVLGLT